MGVPQISVVIPAYNAQRTLADALRSAQAQSFRDIEILVVDDGSADATSAIAESFAAQDGRIRVFRQPNGGVAAARNAAIAQAAAPYLAPLDADDLWHPEKLARQMETMTRRGAGTGLVYCWTQRIDADGRILKDQTIKLRDEGDVLEALAVANIVGHASAPLMRTTLVRAAGGYDPALREAGAQGLEDYKLYLQIAMVSEFGLVPEVLCAYRRSPGAMSRQIGQMRKSHALMMAWFAGVRPDLARRAQRRGRALLDFWLFTESHGQLPKAERYRMLAQTLRRDPVLLTEPWFLESAGRAVFKRIGRRLAPARETPAPPADYLAHVGIADAPAA